MTCCFWIFRQQCSGKGSSECCWCERPDQRRSVRVDICRLLLSVRPIYTILVEPVLLGFNQGIVIVDW